MDNSKSVVTKTVTVLAFYKLESKDNDEMCIIPCLFTLICTYLPQLLENNFIHLQELRKSVGANTHSKVFYLFYCDLNRARR